MILNPLRRKSLIIAGITAIAAVFAACGSGSGDTSLTTPSSNGPDDPSGNANAALFPAPEFPGGHTWFNVSEPLTIADLRGKVVLLDFWTSGCINCQHIIPDLDQLESEFAEELVIIGVHSGKYDREQEDQSVRQAIIEFGLHHPVVNDPDFAIWTQYGARAWPTVVLIDPAGGIVGSRSGENVYSAFQPAIVDVVAEFDARGEIDRTLIASDLESDAVTSAFLSFPSAVLADEAGDRLFIADAGHHRILIASLDGELQDVIGTGERGFDDGFFDEATLNEPQGLAISPDGNTLYIADTRNHAVRSVNLISREVRTIAGTGERAANFPLAGSRAEGTALASPWGLVLHAGTLYIGSAGTHQIWTIDLSDQTISVFAGSGAEGIDDGPPAAATLAQPSGLTTDGETLYWVDPESSSVRRVPINGNGDVETLVGTGLFDFGDADGSGATALLEHPQGIVFTNGTLYVADTYNHKLRTVDPGDFQVVAVAGGSSTGFADGPQGESSLNEPTGLSVAAGVIYIADTNNHVIRLLDPKTNHVSTLALTNLAIATQGISGRTLTVSLPGQTISPDTSTLKIRIETPGDFHLNELVPAELTLSSSNSPVIALDATTVGWATDDPFVELLVDLSASSGDALVTATGEIYYCRSGAEAICLIESVEIALPVTVEPGAALDQLVLDYGLPEPPN